MSRQANLTLTAVAQQEGSVPDIPIRRMKLNHRTREIILGRASLKEPRLNRAINKDTKEVSRIARDDNGYMSRNETIASEHAALILRQDGEVCLEHRAGNFPPTFLNGNRVNEIVTVQNNDVINLGPMGPYYSRSKERLYQPFAIKMNLTFEHVLLSDVESSSSSSDDEVTSEHESSSHHEHSNRLEMICGHEIIEVSDEESVESDEEDNNEDALYTRTSHTIIIDLTESEVEQRADAVDGQTKVFPQVAFVEYDDSSSGEELGHEVGENEITDLEDEMESIDNDSIFRDNDSNAPSEHPIDREPVARSFPRSFNLNYGPDHDILPEQVDFNMSVIEDASEEDESDLDYEPGMSQQQNSFVSRELSDYQETEDRHNCEKESIFEEARKIHNEARQAQHQQEANLPAAIFEAKKIEERIMQEQKQGQAALLIPFEPEQIIDRKTNQEIADHKAQNVEKIELAHEQDLIQELNKKKFEDLVAKANTPSQESIVPSQVPNENTTVFHQQRGANHQTYMPPLAEQHFAAHQDVYADKALRFNAVDAQDLNSATNSCQPLVNLKGEPPSYHCSYEPPAHSFEEFGGARDGNTRYMVKEMAQGQQQPPPTLLMSSSLFGQPMEAGMTLPPPNTKQKECSYARFGVSEPADGQEAAQMYFPDQHSSWRARQNGKVSIHDLVDQDEENEVGSDENLEAVVNMELAKTTSDGSNAAGIRKFQMNDSRCLLSSNFNGPMSVENTLEFAPCKENQKQTTNDLSSSSLATNTSKLSGKVSDDKAELSAPSTPSKKRKHVEFEAHDTIISPVSQKAQERYTSMPANIVSVPNSSARCNTKDIITAIDPKLDTDLTGAVTLAEGSPAENQVQLASPSTREQGKKMEEQVIEKPIVIQTRPSKRLKMMKNAAEKAAYVLAGAAMASVGVFAALVSTAPEDF